MLFLALCVLLCAVSPVNFSDPSCAPDTAGVNATAYGSACLFYIGWLSAVSCGNVTGVVTSAVGIPFLRFDAVPDPALVGVAGCPTTRWRTLTAVVVACNAASGLCSSPAFTPVTAHLAPPSPVPNQGNVWYGT
jgi:hypothetical protein